MGIIEFPEGDEILGTDSDIRQFERQGRINSLYECFKGVASLAYREGAALYEQGKPQEAVTFYVMQKTAEAYRDMMLEIIKQEDMMNYVDGENEE